MPNIATVNRLHRGLYIDADDNSGGGGGNNWQKVVVPYHAGFNFGATDTYTVSGWLYPVTQDIHMLFHRRAVAANDAGWGVNTQWLNGSYRVITIKCTANSPGRLLYAASPYLGLPNRWQFWTVTVSSHLVSGVKFYLNGVEVGVLENVADTLLTSDVITHTNDATIGVGHVSGTYYGSQAYHSNLAVWNRVLTAAEVKTLYGNDGWVSPALATGLQLFLPFNEKSGTSVQDRSPNKNTASLLYYNAPQYALGASNYHVTALPTPSAILS